MSVIPEASAHKLALQLTTIPDCPSSDVAAEALAADLENLCTSEDEARWLVDQARRRWEKWRGTHGLIELLETRRPQLAPGNQAIDYGPKPVPDCAACNDWGHLTGPDGKPQFCACAAGEELRRQNPDWCSRVQKTARILHAPPPPEPEKARLITQADVDEAIRKRREREAS